MKKNRCYKIEYIKKFFYYELIKEEVLGFYCIMNVIKYGYL